MPETDRDDHESLVPSVELVPGGRVDGSIRPPGSKSITNRALICAAFADGVSVLSGALRSEDTEVMIEALRSVGRLIDVSDGGRSNLGARPENDRTLTVHGSASGSKIPPQRKPSDPSEELELFVANSGTSVRFLTAALSAAGGKYLLHGVDRMHERPIADLVEAIAPVIDGHMEATSVGGCPPVRIDGHGWNGHDLQVAGSVSSQYLSGLMMAATIANANATASPPPPTPAASIRIAVCGELVSRPYVDMTAAVMRSFGAEVNLTTNNLRPDQTVVVEVGAQPFQAIEYEIEPDASAASYFWAAAAITAGKIQVQGLSKNAMQGDVGFCDVLDKMGCDVQYGSDFVTVTGKPIRGVDVDMNAISDTVQTLSVVALFADGPTRVRGVAHNRFKETDRIGDLARELRKLGATIDEHEDGLTIHPPVDKSQLHGATLETYHDHRMAMSLSLAGLRVPGVRILNPACTSKTYPEYFADLERLIGRAHRWSSNRPTE